MLILEYILQNLKRLPWDCYACVLNLHISHNQVIFLAELQMIPFPGNSTYHSFTSHVMEPGSSSSPYAPNVSSMNHYVKTKGVLVRKNYFKPFKLFKDMLGENERACNPSSSVNTPKEVNFVILVELQLFYVNFEMELNSLAKLYRPQKLCCVLYQKRT